MRAHGIAALASLTLLATSANVSTTLRRPSERIQADDNLRPAGTLRAGVLTLHLDTRVGIWHPDGDRAPGAPMLAFAESGRPLQIPGPLIRVPAGTEVRVTVTNSIAGGGALTLHGLVSRPARPGASSDTVRLAPGASRVVRFRLDAPGTYYYWATTSDRRLGARIGEDSQLSGAIVVDDPRAARRPDRVLVIGLWADSIGPRQTIGRRRLLLVFNGRSWPHTTRLAYAVGDTVRWRVVNTSADVHPLHLHGFYYRVDSRGDGLTDSAYAEAQRDLVVTERLLPGQTMSMSWVPERAGNWLFHCHFTSHFAAAGPLGVIPDRSAAAVHARHVRNHALEGMSGLVIGVVVAPGGKGGGGASASAPNSGRRRLRLLVRENAGGTDDSPIFGFSLLGAGAAEPPPDSGVRVGPPIVLTRGVPVGITVVNRTREPTAVHWHGIELESYFDGVAGFSGSAGRLSPIVAPGDSFEARFTPPRAGTFIYHTHVDELRQQPAGLAGPIIVLEPGAQHDPATDVPVLISSPRDSLEEQRAVLLNGSSTPAPLEVLAGTRHRLRFINITVARPNMQMQLRQDTTVLGWEVVAKDGAALSPARRTARPARQTVSIGETVDVEFTPPGAGELRLEARTAAGALLAVMPMRVVRAAP